MGLLLFLKISSKEESKHKRHTDLEPETLSIEDIIIKHNTESHVS